MGNPEGWGRLPAQMYRVRPSDHGDQKAGREEYQGIEKKGKITCILIHFMVESKIVIYYKISLFPEEIRGPKDQKEVKQHEQV